MNKLDLFTSQYQPGAATEIENELVLNWYPSRIMQKIGEAPKHSLLELGLGHGYTTNYFSQFFKRHVVIEGSQIIIEQFRQKHPHLHTEIKEGFFEDFETEEQFDVLLMGFILEHVDNPELILSHYRKFLEPGGSLFVAVPNAKSLNRRMGLAMGKITDIYALNENDKALGHQRQYCRNTLKKALHQQGFQVVWEEGIYLKPLPLGYLEKIPDFQDNLKAMCEVGVDFPDLCIGLLMEAKRIPDVTY